MMTETIAEIRARHEAEDVAASWSSRSIIHADRAVLLARVAELEGALKTVRDLLEMAEHDDHSGYISVAHTRRKGALVVAQAALKETP